MLRLILIVLVACPLAAAAQDCAPASLQHELLKRNEVDQAARKTLVANRESKEALDRVLQIDRENTAYLRTVLANCGWPKRSEVGEQAAKAAWRLTQHADMDPQYQVLAAQQLKYAVLADEAAAWDLAVLVDRNRRLTDRPQVYGMQFMTAPGNIIRFYDIVTPSQLDARRKEIGLASFYCWATQISEGNEGASLVWPEKVLFSPHECSDAP
ncbi:DUF6624 domain-containing protein [Lysobacter sp. A378]